MDEGDAQAAWRLIEAARAEGEMGLAIEAAARLGAFRLLAELAEAVWDNSALLAQALDALGLGLKPADIMDINLAVGAVNGQRRNHLLFPIHILVCLVEARHEEPSVAHQPLHGRFWWMLRRVQRGFCRATRSDGSILLEIGEEEVESYTPAKQLSVEAQITVPVVDISGRTRLTSTLPADLAERLERRTQTFENLMSDLSACEDEPYYHEAIAVAEQSFKGWDDAVRRLHHYPTLRHIVTPHGKLIRSISVLFKDFVKVLDMSEIPLDMLRILDLVDLNLPDGAKESPDRLKRLSSLENIALTKLTETPENMARLAALRFPPTLRSFSMDRIVPPDIMAPLIAHIAEDCPNLETFAFVAAGNMSATERKEVFRLIATLPKTVSMKILEHSSVWGDLAKFKTLFDQLDAHLVGRVVDLKVSDGKKDFPLLTALGRSKLAKGLRRLTVTAEPGGLEPLFSSQGWNLDALTLELQYARHMRFYRKKPLDVTFSARGIDRLCKSGALTGIKELAMAGILGSYYTNFLAEALAAGPMRLKRLRLYLSQLGNDGLKTLLNAGALRDLNELELHKGSFKGKGLLALMDPELGPQSPERLVLTKNSMGKPILQALAAWEPLRGVRLLDLTDVRITADNLAILLGSPYLDRRVLRGQ